ncbi:MAG: DUF4004 family protein [Candidatus Bipolaricaulota bacterium]
MASDEENLIAKKEVLQLTGISYGQLYRWKRKGLIPESWFVRRSTFTGQETFFPRDKILERIERVKTMKDSLPLDDLADAITSKIHAKVNVAIDRLRKASWMDETALEACGVAGRDALSLGDALCVAVTSRLRSRARAEELTMAQRTLKAQLNEAFLERIGERTLHLHLLRKRLSAGGISAEISFVAVGPIELVFDPEVERVEAVDLRDALERIKLDLAEGDEGSCGGTESEREEER